MTVEEYLRAVNGVFGDKELTGEDIEMVGFIDVMPNVEYIAAMQAKFIIESGNIIVQRDFTTSDGEVSLEKVTPLNTNISECCPENKTTLQVLTDTIEGLKEIQESSFIDKTDYQSRIDTLEKALMAMPQTEVAPAKVSSHK